ncbi:hypothetical protein ACOI1C_00490 [Bacillus sp. DJP31]|uniref:hypothetical protein n=1 Tax=Bacillus sp. DJP31 TaxID=3409789 RepID=UPI003BB63974
MTVIDFQQVKTKKENAILKVESHTICIDMKIPVQEVSYWIHVLTYSTHTVGHLLQDEAQEKEQMLLQEEYLVLQDLMEKMLVFIGYETSEDINEITFPFTFKEVIILEGQLEHFIEACLSYDDHEYLMITEKYRNTLYAILEDQAEEFDTMTKYIIKQATGK